MSDEVGTAVQIDVEPLWTIDQLAAYLQVSIATVRKWRTVGEAPPALFAGKHLRWRREDVMTWLGTPH